MIMGYKLNKLPNWMTIKPFIVCVLFACNNQLQGTNLRVHCPMRSISANPLLL